MSSHRTARMDISIRDRLLQIAKHENRDFNVILNLYYQERFLARLAISRYQKRFLLKGGLLQAPDLPTEETAVLLAKVRNTRGRTWHLRRQ